MTTAKSSKRQQKKQTRQVGAAIKHEAATTMYLITACTAPCVFAFGVYLFVLFLLLPRWNAEGALV
jgi:hypothetical protein